MFAWSSALVRSQGPTMSGFVMVSATVPRSFSTPS
jgi:hypothetical protein